MYNWKENTLRIAAKKKKTHIHTQKQYKENHIWPEQRLTSLRDAKILNEDTRWMGKNIFRNSSCWCTASVFFFVLPVCCCPLAQLQDAINFRTEDENQGEKTMMCRDQKSTMFPVGWLIEISLWVNYTAEFRVCILRVSLMNFVFTLLSETCWWSSLFFLRAYSFKYNAMHFNKHIKSPNRDHPT